MSRPFSQAKIVAREAGCKTFEGAPCKRCQTVEKYVSNGSCVECSKVLAAKIRKSLPKRNTETVNGLPCLQCGGTERYLSNGQCVCCKRESQARRRRERREVET